MFTRSPRVQRRVVITGLGILSPVGVGVSENWDNLVNGRSGIERISQWDPSSLASQIAGEVRGWDPSDLLSPKELRKIDRFIAMALEATRQAIEDAGLEFDQNEKLRVKTGSLIGVGNGWAPLHCQSTQPVQGKWASKSFSIFYPSIYYKHGLWSCLH